MHPATGQPVDYVIHDYGGQEEFLSNHANFMSKDHSLYVIVLPVSEIGGSLSECRVRTLDEIVHRYIFWLRFVFSVVRRDDTFPVFADDTKGSAALSHHMAVEHTNPNAHTAHRGIPIIPVINKFSRLNDSLDDSYYPLYWLLD